MPVHDIALSYSFPFRNWEKHVRTAVIC